MASMKSYITFNEFWPYLKDEAKRRGWNVGTFMERCDIPRQRYSEFLNPRSLTISYMIKLMGGLNLTVENVEKMSGKKFSPEQIKKLKLGSFVAHEELIEALSEDTELLNLVQMQVKLRRK